MNIFSQQSSKIKNTVKIGALLLLGTLSQAANAADVCSGGACANWKSDPNGVVVQWYGNEKTEIVDHGPWHKTHGSATLSASSSNCYTEYASIGFDFNIPLNFADLTISGEKSTEYKVCNSRTAGLSCPNEFPTTKDVRAELHVEMGYARVRFTGDLGHYKAPKRYSCPLGGRWYAMRGSSVGQCRFSEDYSVYKDVWWPKEDTTACVYRNK